MRLHRFNIFGNISMMAVTRPGLNTMNNRNVSQRDAAFPQLDWKDRCTVYGGIVLVSVLSWWYMVHSSHAMHSQSQMKMWMPPAAGGRGWYAEDFAILFGMWVVMMLAMMMPTVFPMASIHASLCKQRRAGGGSVVLSNVLVLGYAFAWIVFSVIGVAVQWPLHVTGVLSPMMEPYTLLFSGAVLVLAGVYQWTPMKTACLERCRSPLGFLIQHWKNGVLGTFAAGMRYGLFCVGCCWALMFLMLALGMMNILWMAAIALFVLAEKVAPFGSVVRTAAGVVFSAWGCYWLFVHFGA